ncbi:MAG TPA: hypothetical protein VGE41_05450, partial [Verrucomicrobiae bacterium]
MNPLQTFAIILAAYLAVYFETTFNGLRSFLGAQVDLLPSLMVYAGLSSGWPTVTGLAIAGGLFYDSQSANPLGTSILPLFLIGWVIQRYRGLILREQRFAQFILGAGASALAPLMGLLILINTDKQPLISWFSLWQWILMAVLGGASAPAWFWTFDKVSLALSYSRTT